MAVRRGLFRLWIVVTVCWVASVGASTWMTLVPDELVTPNVESLNNPRGGGPVTDPDVLARFHASQTAPTGASDRGKEDNKHSSVMGAFDDLIPGGSTTAAPPAPSGGTFDDLIPGGSDNKRDRAHDKNESPAFDPHKPYTVIRSAERAQQVKTAAVVAFVPPVIVIALGAALGWAINGFRQ
jgi:hypothetical protein